MEPLTYIKQNESDFLCEDYMVMMNRKDCSDCKAYKNCTNKCKV